MADHGDATSRESNWSKASLAVMGFRQFAQAVLESRAEFVRLWGREPSVDDICAALGVYQRPPTV